MVTRIDIPREKTYAATLDKVWTASLNAFAERGIPSQIIDKSSGIISAGNMTPRQNWYECAWRMAGITSKGGFIAPSDQSINMTLNIVVRDNKNGSVTVTVNSSFSRIFTEKTWEAPQRCDSTGSLENAIWRSIEDSLKIWI